MVSGGAPVGMPQQDGTWTRPGIIPLRPLRLGEIYDGAFGAVRSNPLAVLGWAAVVVVISVAISTTLTGVFEHGLLTTVTSPTFASDDFSGADLRRLVRSMSTAAPAAALALAASTLVQLVCRAVLSGVVTVAVSSAVLGRKLGAGALGERMRPRLLPLIGLSVLTSLVSGAVFAVALIPGVVLLGVAAAGGGGTGTVVAGVVLLLLGFLVGLAVWAVLEVRWLLAPPALVLEPQPVIASMRRAWALSRGAFWRLLGIELLTSVILAAAAGVISFPFSLIGGVVSGVLGGGTASLVATLGVSSVGSAIASTIVLPLGAAVVALLYIDQRMRREGLDVELAAAAAATPAPA